MITASDKTLLISELFFRLESAENCAASFDINSFARCYHLIHEIDLRTHKMLYKVSEMFLCDTLEN